MELFDQFQLHGIEVRVHSVDLTDCVLGRPGEFAWHSSGAARGAAGCGHEFGIGVKTFPAQTDLGGPLCVDDLSEEHHRGSGLRPDDPPEHPGVTTTRMDAEIQKATVVSSFGTGKAQIACKGQVHSGTHRRSVHCGHRGQRGSGH